MDRPWKVVFAFVGVFVAGAVFGGVFVLSSSVGRADRPAKAGKAAAKEPGGRIYPDRKSTRLNSSHVSESRMPSSA